MNHFQNSPGLFGWGVVLGLIVGLNVQGIWPSVPLHASATHGLEKFAIATGLVDTGVEALYFLDYLTGDMRAAVINPKTGKFNAFFTRNIAADFGGAGRNTGYLMVTGSVDMPRGTAKFQYASSIVYVAEATTGRWRPTRFLGTPAIRRPARRSMANSSRSMCGRSAPRSSATSPHNPAAAVATRRRMKIQVNGESREVAAGSTVAGCSANSA